MSLDHAARSRPVSLKRSALLRLLLVAVGMIVAPIPVVPLHSVVLPVVLTIPPVLRRQITPVGAVLVVLPVVIITVVPIIDSHLDAAFLRPGASHDCGWCSNGRQPRIVNLCSDSYSARRSPPSRRYLDSQPNKRWLCTVCVTVYVLFSTFMKAKVASNPDLLHKLHGQEERWKWPISDRIQNPLCDPRSSGQSKYGQIRLGCG
jgi:hypothetical protein